MAGSGVPGRLPHRLPVRFPHTCSYAVPTTIPLELERNRGADETICMPCFDRECRFNHYRCLRDLPPQRVDAALHSLFERA